MVAMVTYADAIRGAMKFAFGKEPVFVREGGSIGAVLSMEKVLKAQNAAVKGFVRFAVGDGIEKAKTDFAAEVAAATKL